MFRYPTFLILITTLLTSCSNAAATPTPQTINVQYTASSRPWLSDLYNCSGGNTIVAEQRAADMFDPVVDIAIRIGQPAILSTPAYQIGTESLLIVVNPASPVTTLSAGQVRRLFTGQITDWSQINPAKNGAVRVWVFPPGEDVEQVFEQAILGNTPVTSLARLANSPDEMSQAVAGDSNAIGLLSSHLKMNNVTSVFAAFSAPVLAITPSNPTGVVRQILACLPK